MNGLGERATRPSFTVELVGIPGSGKSRLARWLATELGRQGVPVAEPQRRYDSTVPAGRRITRKAVACTAVGLTAPAHTARLVGRLAQSGQSRSADVAGRLVQLLVARDVARRAARQRGVSVVDEGLMQALWSVGLRGDLSRGLPLVTALEHEQPADLLVVLRVPSEVALTRLSARSSQHSRIQLVPESDRLAELKRGARLLDELVEWWVSRPGGPREVCALAHVEEDSQERAQLLERLYAAAAGLG